MNAGYVIRRDPLAWRLLIDACSSQQLMSDAVRCRGRADIVP
jgi:hypothetical protein